MAITIDPEDNSHYMAEIKIGDDVIVSNEFNFDITEEGGDAKYVTNSQDAIRYGSSKNTYEWGASGVEPEFYKLLLQCKLEGKLFTVQIFDFGPDGNYEHQGTMKFAKITELNRSFGDDGVTIDVSGSALSLTPPN